MYTVTDTEVGRAPPYRWKSNRAPLPLEEEEESVPPKFILRSVTAFTNRV
jgi:hypothetical protein